MKKITFFLALLAMAVASMAQTQKVAILETVDRNGDISYGIKLLLRSSITSAISNTPGYEGYDRVDMASIAGEQEFQRTGNVSDSQIKQLGVATGASYVLVAEAAKYDEKNIIITAKILDVESFGVKSSAVQITGTTAKEMKRSCATLAAELLKPVTDYNQPKQEESPKKAKPEPEPEPEVVPPPAPVKVEVPTPTPAESYTPAYTRPLYEFEPEYTRRTFWMGISIDGGWVWLDDWGGTIDPISYVGLTLDFSFSIGKWFSLGPYLSLGFVYWDFGWPGGFAAGCMTKFSFNNNAAILLGGGFGWYDSYGGYESFQPQIRFGFKTARSFFMTGTVLFGPGGGVSGLGGIGFSFGGKLK